MPRFQSSGGIVTREAPLRSWSAAVLVFWAQLAFAQTPATSTLPPIGLPLPPIGLPLAPIGLAPPSDTRPPAPPTRGPGRPHHRPAPWIWGPTVIYVPTYGSERPGDVVAAPPAPAAPVVAEDRTTPQIPGRLSLDLTPARVGQVWVDGVFVGSAADAAAGVALEPGRHQIEVRDPGYAPLSFAVNVEAGRPLTFRSALTPVEPPSAEPSPQRGRATTPETRAAAPPPSAPPKALYYVPGCYLGDVPPAEARLPASCDLSKTVIYRP